MPSLRAPIARAILLGGRRSTAAAAAYAPSAVSLNQTVSLAVKGSSVGVTNTGRIIQNFWVRGSVGTPAHPGSGAESNWGAGNGDLIGNYSATGDSETAPGIINVWDNLSGTLGTARFNANDSTGGTNHGWEAYKTNFWVNTAWQCYTWIGDFTTTPPRVALYFNGVKQTLTSNAANGTVTPPLIVDINNAAGFGFNVVTLSGQPGAFDVADVFMDTHTTGLLDSSSNLTVPISTFYNNGPVDPGANGSGFLGTQPEFWFTGNKAAFGTNRGTATGTFALSNPTATSSQVAALFTAPYGPAGPPTDRPTLKWLSPNHITGQNAATVSLTTNNLGNAIALGDLLMLAVQLCDTAVSFNRLIVTPTGWTALAPSGLSLPNVSSTNPTNTAFFWKIADVTDVTASNADWTAAPVVAWTANANALRSGSWMVFNYGAATIQAAAAQYNTATTAPVAPTVTPTSAPATLLTMFGEYDNSRSGTFTVPAGQELRFRKTDISGGSPSWYSLSDEALATTSATGTRTAGQQNAGPGVAFSIVIGK